MNTRFPPRDTAPLANPDFEALLDRLTTLEHNQRDMLFLLRTLRRALYNARVEISSETRRIHRQIIRLAPYNGRCPCCLETQVVADKTAR